MFRLVIVGIACLALPLSAIAEADSENEKLCLQFYEALNAGELEVIDELIAEDFVEHEVFPGLGSGREDLKKFFTMMRTAFPDLTFDVEFTTCDGEMVTAYITMSGTHEGEFMGMPASGNAFSTKTVDIVRIVDGKAVAHWGATDTGTMMQQLQGETEMAPADE